MAKIITTEQLDSLDSFSADEVHWLYNGLDCCVTGEIFDNISAVVDDTCRATYEFSKSLQAPVLEMSLRGLRVNQVRKRKVLQDFRKKLDQLTIQIKAIVEDGVGVPNFNWRSPVQVKHLLYDVMGLPVQKKRNTAGIFAPSVDRDALEKLHMYIIAEPVIQHLLALRDLGKSIGFLETPLDSDGRMRTQFKIAGTDTGRFASSATDFDTGTNLQNVTSSLRSVFVADPGYKFANLDLEQADSRNVGALCWNTLIERGDWNEASAGKYLDACESGDLHTTVCKMANPLMPWGDGRTDREIADQIAYRNKTFRDTSKVLGHGSNYLGQPVTMAKHSKLPVKMVKAFHEAYFQAFPCIPEWHKSVFWKLENQGFLQTPFGRRRFFFGRPKDGTTQRAAVANDPQSMTGDEINLGILRLWRANRVQLLVQVHDSILFQYKEEEEAEIIPWALEALKTHLVLARGREFHVPTEAMTGWNWGYYSKDDPRAPDNLDGLKKWKGSDPRVRQETQTQLSIWGL